MRLSWYANSMVAVFSIWQGNRCTGTFRLPLADLDRMVRTLQAGPPMPASAAPQGYGPGYTVQHPYNDDRFAEAPPAYTEYQAPAPSYENYGGEPYQGESYQAESYQAEPYQAEAYQQNYGFGQTHAAPYGSYQPADYSSAQADERTRSLEAPAQAGYGLTDYDPPNYSDRPGSHRRPSHSDDYGDPGDPEPIPDTAMLSFPSVPARNGPGAYR